MDWAALVSGWLKLEIEIILCRWSTHFILLRTVSSGHVPKEFLLLEWKDHHEIIPIHFRIRLAQCSKYSSKSLGPQLINSNPHTAGNMRCPQMEIPSNWQNLRWYHFLHENYFILHSEVWVRLICRPSKIKLMAYWVSILQSFDKEQGKKVCKVTALRCYQCFSLHFLLATAKWLLPQPLHGWVVNCAGAQ